MDIFKKRIDEITEIDLTNLESLPSNFESHRIEYKTFYDISKKEVYGNEFLRDVIAFANSDIDAALIIYGFNDSHQLIGMKRSPNFNENELQNHFVNLLSAKIEPNILNFVKIQPVTLKSGKFVLIVKIFRNNEVVYGIRQKLLKRIYGKEVDAYEFWIRSSGNKQHLSLSTIINHLNAIQFPILNISTKPNYKSNKKNLKRKIARTIKKSYKFDLGVPKYIPIRLFIRNDGKQVATNITAMFKCVTDSRIEFINKWQYKQSFDYNRIMKKQMNFFNRTIHKFKSIIKKDKKERKEKNPSIRIKKGLTTNEFSLQFSFERLRPRDRYSLPFYIHVPKDINLDNIVFSTKIRSNEITSDKTEKFYMKLN